MNRSKCIVVLASVIIAIVTVGEARWVISTNLTNRTAVPNFIDYIYLDGLLSMKPESVNIIH
jgi:hypothetical protein